MIRIKNGMIKLLPDFHREIFILANIIIKKIDAGVIEFNKELEQLKELHEESKSNFSGFGIRKQRTTMLKCSIKILKGYQKTVDDERYKKMDHVMISNNPELVKGCFKRLAECESLYFENR